MHTIRVSFGLRNTKECSMTYRDRAKRIIVKNASKLTTTACFIQGESSGYIISVIIFIINMPYTAC